MNRIPENFFKTSTGAGHKADINEIKEVHRNKIEQMPKAAKELSGIFTGAIMTDCDAVKSVSELIQEGIEDFSQFVDKIKDLSHREYKILTLLLAMGEMYMQFHVEEETLAMVERARRKKEGN